MEDVHCEMERASAPSRPPRHRRLRGLAWGVGALGLLAVGAIGGILGSRYLGDVLPALGGLRPVPVATAPPSPPAALPSTAPPAASAPAAAAEVFLTPEAITRAAHRIGHLRRPARARRGSLPRPGIVHLTRSNYAAQQ